MIYYYDTPSESITIMVKLESFLFFSVVKLTGPLKNTFYAVFFFVIGNVRIEKMT